MTILIVQTGSSSAPAVLAAGNDFDVLFRHSLGVAGKSAAVVRPYLDQPLPNPADYAGVILTGSPANVSAGAPWSERTAAWVRGVVEGDVPLLGVCFGHQLIGHALGGRVAANPCGPEYGAVALSLSPKIDDPLFKGPLRQGIKVFTAHGETVQVLPKGAEVFAHSAAEPHHAVRFARRAWGVQFHPEFTAPVMAAILDHEADELARAGLDLAARRADLTSVADNDGRKLFGRFLVLCGG